MKGELGSDREARVNQVKEDMLGESFRQDNSLCKGLRWERPLWVKNDVSKYWSQMFWCPRM